MKKLVLSSVFLSIVALLSAQNKLPIQSIHAHTEKCKWKNVEITYGQMSLTKHHPVYTEEIPKSEIIDIHNLDEKRTKKIKKTARKFNSCKVIIDTSSYTHLGEGLKDLKNRKEKFHFINYVFPAQVASYTTHYQNMRENGKSKNY